MITACMKMIAAGQKSCDDIRAPTSSLEIEVDYGE